MSFIIYVLLCEHEKIYVGRCRRDRAYERYNEHKSGRGSSFTQMYPMKDVLEVFYSDNPQDEDNTVMDLMQNNGIDNVRGGTFSSLQLPEHQIRTLNDQLRHNRGACIRCGKTGHFVDACPERNSRNMNMSGQNTTRREGRGGTRETEASCFTCGRIGHFADNCPTRRTNMNIRPNNARSGGQRQGKGQEVCFKCGRTGHFASTCFARTTLNGNMIHGHNRVQKRCKKFTRYDSDSDSYSD